MWYKSPSYVSVLCLRVSLGLSMLMLGISFYRDFAPFYANVTDGLGALKILGTLWSYLLPAFFIFAGGMLVIGRYAFVTAWVGGIALGSIPVGMVMKTLMTNFPLPQVLEFIFPVLLWILVMHAALTTTTMQDVVEAEEADDE